MDNTTLKEKLFNYFSDNHEDFIDFVINNLESWSFTFTFYWENNKEFYSDLYSQGLDNPSEMFYVILSSTNNNNFNFNDNYIRYDDNQLITMSTGEYFNYLIEYFDEIIYDITTNINTEYLTIKNQELKDIILSNTKQHVMYCETCENELTNVTVYQHAIVKREVSIKTYEHDNYDVVDENSISVDEYDEITTIRCEGCGEEVTGDQFEIIKDNIY